MIVSPPCCSIPCIVCCLAPGGMLRDVVEDTEEATAVMHKPEVQGHSMRLGYIEITCSVNVYRVPRTESHHYRSAGPCSLHS